MTSRTQPGVFSSAEKVSILADVTALEARHPAAPTVYENLSTNANVQILATDRVVRVLEATDQVEQHS